MIKLIIYYRFFGCQNYDFYRDFYSPVKHKIYSLAIFIIAVKKSCDGAKNIYIHGDCYISLYAIN